MSPSLQEKNTHTWSRLPPVSISDNMLTKLNYLPTGDATIKRANVNVAAADLAADDSCSIGPTDADTDASSMFCHDA